MSTSDILSQDEIDALLGGMSEGEIETETAPVPDDGEVRTYDFSSQDRFVRGRMPTLETVHERFARSLRKGLYRLLRRSPEIGVSNVQLMKYSEYVEGLSVPTNINLVKCRPLRGTAMFTLDPRLVFTVVDTYFGGTGRAEAAQEDREFTPAELRVVEILLERLFVDLRAAWEPVLPLVFERVGSESNPRLANVVSPSDVIVVTVLSIELEGGGGELHLAFPYAMLEPVRELLDTGVPGGRGERDDTWTRSLRREIEAVDLELVVGLGGVPLTLRELLAFAPGEVIPLEMPPTVSAVVGDVAVLCGRFGTSGGCLAVKVEEFVASSGREAATREETLES